MKIAYLAAAALFLTACQPSAKTGEPAKATEAPKLYYVNDAIPLANGVIATLEAGDFYYNWANAPKGAVAMKVDISVANTGTKPMPADKFPEVHLVDAAGTVYNADAGLTGMFQMENAVNRKAVSDLNPGLAVNDIAVFELANSQVDSSTWFVTIGGVRVAMCSRKTAVNGVCEKYVLKNPKE